MRASYRFNDDFYFHYDNATYWDIIKYYLGLATGYAIAIIFIWWLILEIGGVETLSEKLNGTYKFFEFIYKFLDIIFKHLEAFCEKAEPIVNDL